MPRSAPQTPASEDSAAGPGPTGSTLPGKNPRLLPTPSLSPAEFEDFTERLLSAHRFCPKPVRHVIRVERWGRPGDPQDGIDFEGEYSDGTTVSWQCKRYDKLTVRNVRDAVRACTFTADEHNLVFSGEASRPVRDEIAKHPKWRLLDQRGLGRLLDDLPLHKRRDVLDATWGVQKRKLLLEVPGEDAFLSISTFAADRLDPNAVLNDLGPRVGRELEFAALASALDRSMDWPPIVIVTGPGGRGKTRLLVEVLTAFQSDNPQTAVLWLSPGRTVDAAALAELPHTPAVIIVDDAHRDPAALALLLNYARSAEGTQLVLASRPTGTTPLRAEIADARYALSQVGTVPVGELSKREAHRLVESLADGLGLTLAAREYFAEQAVNSPHVAVVAANLIRRGELKAPPSVDVGLREHVLARYRELAAGDLDGFDGSTVRRVLAVYDALGPVDDSDGDLRATIAAFCGLKRVNLLRLCERLHDRGVLVTRGGLTRVVPDVLADQILEGEAAIGRHDTGFATELWERFGAVHGERLVITLGELDWRLARQGGPSVMGPVWEAVRAELHATDYEGLHAALRRLGSLPATQPHALIGVLEDLRRRLDEDEPQSSAVAAPRTGHAGAATTHNPAQPENSVYTLFGLKPIDADDIRALMPELYGQCAANAPDLLEPVLDALWSLRRLDSRPTHQHPGHAERVITDRLANVGELPDESFPLRIVTRVNEWFAEPADDGEATTPMFALRPLLAKEGEHHVMETRRSLTFRPFAVSAAWARPVRDAIRATLRTQACGADLRRAAAAVRLLGDALRQPAGLFGRPVSPDEVLAWESDDLATLKVLHEAATTTDSPVVRRLIRQQIAWTAERAMSLPARHSALTLVTYLDELDDDLVELLLHGRGAGEPTRRGVPVPTLEELEAAQAAQAVQESALSQEELEAARSAQIRDLVARRDEVHQLLVERVVQDLTAGQNPVQIVDALDECSRTIRTALPEHNLSLWALWRHLSLTRRELVPVVAREITARPPGPLDQNLDQLLDAWAAHDEQGLLSWLTELPVRRLEVRLAVATAFINYGWTDRGSPFTDLHRRGMHDPDPGVRDRFMMGSHKLLATDPAGTVERLLTGGVSPFGATRVLEAACGYDGIPWGRGLSRLDADAVLNLIGHAGWDDYIVQQIAAGIASAYPKLVLDHLAAAYHSGHRLPSSVEGFAAVFDDEAEALVQWLVGQAHQSPTPGMAAVVDLVLSGRLTTAQAQRLDASVDRFEAAGLLAFLPLLRDITIWPLQQPHLARRFLLKARELGADTAAQTRAEIVAGMQIRHWSSWNGFSEELERARTAAAACADAETDPELKKDFQQAHADVDALVSRARQRYEEDEDD